MTPSIMGRGGSLTPASADALDWLAEYGPATAADYSDDMGLSESVGVKRFRQLERHGLVERAGRHGCARVTRLSARGMTVWRLMWRAREAERVVAEVQQQLEAMLRNRGEVREASS